MKWFLSWPCVGVLVVLTTLAPTSALATPDIGVRQRRIILGASRDSLYSVLIQRSNPSSYYADDDSIFFCRHAVETGSEIDRQLIRVIAQRDSTTMGTWTSKDVPVPPFDMSKFMIEHEVQYVFPVEPEDGITITFRDDSVFMLKGSQAIALVDTLNLLSPELEQLRRQQPFGVDVRRIDVYEVGTLTGKRTFLLVDYVIEKFDFLQKVVAVDSKRLHEGFRKLRSGR